jgi:FMN phosphatase YigB (HAD superfamily)
VRVVQPDLSSARAIVFDLDGTLYRQDSLRRAMLLRLARAHALDPLKGIRTARVLAAYRRAQEHLRGPQPSAGNDSLPASLESAQVRLACEWTGADPEFVKRCVTRWMERDPLPILIHYIRPGLKDFLHTCRVRGLRLAVLSDYPAEAKLAALGLDGMFDVVLAAQSPEVGAFKPDPRGLFAVARRLSVQPDACIYIGDRVEVDAAAAEAAAMPCYIIERPANRSMGTWTPVAGFAELQAMLEAQEPAQPTLDRC